MTQGIVFTPLLSLSLRAKRGNLGGGDNVRFFAALSICSHEVLTSCPDLERSGLLLWALT
jgi:hypothetical protein